ncbi:MAG: MFS transporter [Bacteroidales bacterium]|nr:MFS transporter [Bacteroidales bacterium]
MQAKPIQKYSTLLSLYLAQSIPMSFFSTVMPVIMRTENFSLTSIGLIQLIKLPWILKFLWAPMIDKSATTLRKYKQWILFSELFYALVIFSIGFLDLETSFTSIIVLMLIAFTASATQDIATDAFAILILNKDERGFGNSMQSAGTFLGTLTGSGVLLVIYHYYGWQMLLAGLAAFVLLAIVPLYFYKSKGAISATSSKNIFLKDIYLFFAQIGIGKRIVLLVFYYSGIIGILTMVKPWMVDLGYSIKEIGIISGIYGPASGAAMAFATGFIIRYLGKRKSLFLVAYLGLFDGIYFSWLSSFSPELSQLLPAILLLWGTYGMASVVIYTISMDIVRNGREGTDFTIQIVLTHLSSLIIAVGSGKTAQALGYTGLFKIEIALALFVLLIIPYLYKKNES